MPITTKMSPSLKRWAELKGFATREEEEARSKEEAQVKCTWEEIGNKPEVFKPEEHDHEQYATIEVVEKKVADLVDSAPEALNTLRELADALSEKGDAAAIVEQISKVDAKVDAISLESLGYEEPDLSVFALKTEVPVLPENHVTQDELATAISEVEEQIPSIEGLASEKFVEEMIAAVDHSSYAVKSEVEASINEVKSMIPEVPSHDKVVEYQDFTFNGQTRKTIQLANYDSISGVATTGEGHNLVMLSKWDVADFGATGVHLNLNTKDTVTINDDKVVATLEDVTKAVDAIVIPSVKGLASEEFVNTEIARVEAKIPSIPSHDDFALKTDIPSVVNFATKEEVATAKSEAILAASDDAASKKDLESAIANVVKYEDFTYNGESRKTIQLDNYDSISGVTTDGSGVNLAMISKWDVADFGAPSVYMNLNTKMYELEDGSTYPAITINDKPEWAIATVEYVGQQVSAIKDSIPAIPTDHVTLEELAAAVYRINTLEDKVSDLSKTNITTVVAGKSASVVDEAADLVIAVAEDSTVTENTTYTGKSVDVKSMEVSSANVVLKATNGDVSITNFNSTGTVDTGKGSAIIIDTNEHIKITNSDISQISYNGFELGKYTTPKSVLIDNVKFEDKLTNNAISIFNHTENAVITISNCHFSNVSNALRISNVNNVPCTINVINCVVDSWADSSTGYSGFLICQDYSSASASDEVANNRFGSDKITVNFINCVGPNGKKFTEFGDPEDFCGTANDNQLVYVWYDKSKAMQPYGDGSAYPKIVIK